MLQRLRDLFARLRLRTLMAAVGAVVIGVLDVMHVIDLHSLVSLFVHEARVGQVVAVLGLVFGLLRLVTSTAVLAPKDDDE
jgi:hypothetical protein